MDKKQGNILAQGDDQEEANLLTNLTLSTVKECDIDETDRNFCFQVRGDLFLLTKGLIKMKLLVSVSIQFGFY